MSSAQWAVTLTIGEVGRTASGCNVRTPHIIMILNDNYYRNIDHNFRNDGRIIITSMALWGEYE